MPYSSITWNISCFQSAWNIIQYILEIWYLTFLNLCSTQIKEWLIYICTEHFFLVIFTLCYSLYCNCFSNLMIKKAIYSFVLHLKFSKSIAIAVVKVPIKLTILLSRSSVNYRLISESKWLLWFFHFLSETEVKC